MKTTINIGNFDFKGIYTEQSLLPATHYKNTITHTGSGNFGIGQQFSLDNSGLDVQCEKYTTLNTDWHIKDGLLKEQGDQLATGFHNTNEWSVGGSYKIEAYTGYPSLIYNITNDPAYPSEYFVTLNDVNPQGILNVLGGVYFLNCLHKNKCAFYSASSGETNEYDVVAIVQKTPQELLFDAIQHKDELSALAQIELIKNSGERNFYSNILPAFIDGNIRTESALVYSNLQNPHLQETTVGKRLAEDYLYFYRGKVVENEVINSDFRTKKSDTRSMKAGVKPEMIEQLIIYPNPASKQVFVSDNQGHNKAEVYSQEGRILISQKVEQEKSYSLDVSMLRAGIYYLHLTKSDNTIKIIKIAIL